MSLGVAEWWRGLWSWDRVRDTIRSLPGRLGFARNRELKFFRLVLNLETGEVFDEILGRFLTDRERYGLYYILYNHAQTRYDIGELGEYLTLSQVCPALHCPMVKENLEAFLKLSSGIFASRPELLYRAAEPFGYERLDIGDVAVKIYTLPRVPIAVALWLGEEGELPPSVSILFDKSVTSYLECEAAQILAGVLLARLIISLARYGGTDIGGIRYSYRYQCSE